MGLYYPAQRDMTIEQMSPRETNDGQHSVVEYIVTTDVIDISPAAIEEVRRDAIVDEATPYSRQGSVLCFTVVVGKNKKLPSNAELDRIADKIRQHSEPAPEKASNRKKRN